MRSAHTAAAIVLIFAPLLAPSMAAAAERLCPSAAGALAAAVKRDIAARRYPGAAYAVAIDGHTVLAQAIGERDVTSHAPMRPDSIFRLASMSKPITAAAIMVLADEGRLNLDDPVARFIPQFKPEKSGSKPITLRDLLTHTAGFDGPPPPAPQAAAENTLAGRVPGFARLHPAWPPGSRFQYSPQTGFDILSRVVEIASGQTFGQFLSVRLFAPLGMKDTAFRLNAAQRKRLVSIYDAAGGTLVPSDASFASDTYQSGAAGLYGTMHDYLRFARMLEAGGTFAGKRILSPRAVEQMHAFQLPPGFAGLPAETGWGLAMRVIARDPVLPAGSYGWSGAFGTHFWIDPARRVTAVFMVNLGNAGGADARTARDYETRVMAALSPSCAGTTSKPISKPEKNPAP